jgi:hypothetical protein
MKFTNTMGTFFTKLKLFFHTVSFIINTLYPSLHEMLYAGHLKLLAEVSELFMHAVLQGAKSRL